MRSAAAAQARQGGERQQPGARGGGDRVDVLGVHAGDDRGAGAGREAVDRGRGAVGPQQVAVAQDVAAARACARGVDRQLKMF